MGTTRDIRTVALLDEPVRRRLYEYVRSRKQPVGRDEAAGAAGVSRGLAAFHLDKLAEAGLLEVEYRRLSGRSGPGAGRPAKLYRPSASRLSVTIPQTRYELAGRILATAVEERDPRESAEDAVRRVAGRFGAELGRGLRGRAGARDPFEGARAVMEELGFEPEVQEVRDGRILLRNCPFHELVDSHRDLVCSMNHALLSALLEGLGQEVTASGLRAAPTDAPGYCCVAVVAGPRRG